MFRYPCLSTLAATLAAAFSLCVSVLLASDPLFAEEGASARCVRPEPRDRKSSRPKIAELKTRLDEGDEIATFKALQTALSEVGDGATYVWHRHNGRISGSFQPTASFKNASGKVCRRVRIMLASGTFTRTAEGTACRQDDGAWSLEG